MNDAAPPPEAPEPEPRILAWRALAEELTPAKSLARVDSATARVLTNVTVVGTLLTGLGLLAARLPPTNAPARNLALAAVVTAVLGVACALTSQVLSVRKGLNTNNLVVVKAWYRAQFRRRAYPARAATVLMLASVLLAGGSAVVLLATPEDGRLSLAVSEVSTAPAASPDGATVTVDVAFRGPTEASTVTVVVTATIVGEATVLARAALTPGLDGTASRSLTVSGVPEGATVEVAANGGRRRCDAAWDLGGAAPPAVTCGTEGD